MELMPIPIRTDFKHMAKGIPVSNNVLYSPYTMCLSVVYLLHSLSGLLSLYTTFILRISAIPECGGIKFQLCYTLV